MGKIACTRCRRSKRKCVWETSSTSCVRCTQLNLSSQCTLPTHARPRGRPPSTLSTTTSSSSSSRKRKHVPLPLPPPLLPPQPHTLQAAQCLTSLLGPPIPLTYVVAPVLADVCSDPATSSTLSSLAPLPALSPVLHLLLHAAAALGALNDTRPADARFHTAAANATLPSLLGIVSDTAALAHFVLALSFYDSAPTRMAAHLALAQDVLLRLTPQPAAAPSSGTLSDPNDHHTPLFTTLPRPPIELFFAVTDALLSRAALYGLSPLVSTHDLRSSHTAAVDFQSLVALFIHSHTPATPLAAHARILALGFFGARQIDLSAWDPSTPLASAALISILDAADALRNIAPPSPVQPPQDWNVEPGSPLDIALQKAESVIEADAEMEDHFGASPLAVNWLLSTQLRSALLSLLRSVDPPEVPLDAITTALASAMAKGPPITAPVVDPIVSALVPVFWAAISFRHAPLLDLLSHVHIISRYLAAFASLASLVSTPNRNDDPPDHHPDDPSPDPSPLSSTSSPPPHSTPYNGDLDASMFGTDFDIDLDWFTLPGLPPLQ